MIKNDTHMAKLFMSPPFKCHLTLNNLSQFKSIKLLLHKDIFSINTTLTTYTKHAYTLWTTAIFLLTLPIKITQNKNR